jgi:hypothetical protein
MILLPFVLLFACSDEIYECEVRDDCPLDIELCTEAVKERNAIGIRTGLTVSDHYYYVDGEEFHCENPMDPDGCTETLLAAEAAAGCPLEDSR